MGHRQNVDGWAQALDLRKSSIPATLTLKSFTRHTPHPPLCLIKLEVCFNGENLLEQVEALVKTKTIHSCSWLS